MLRSDLHKRRSAHGSWVFRICWILCNSHINWLFLLELLLFILQGWRPNQYVHALWQDNAASDIANHSSREP